MKSKKERAFYTQIVFYFTCILFLYLKPEVFSLPHVLTFLSAAGLCLASYHVTQGIVDFKNGVKSEGG